MTNVIQKLKEKLPGAIIHEGAEIDLNCRVDAGCEISAQAILHPGVAICKNTHIIGAVQIDMDAIIRENVTLVGPLHIKTHAFIAHDAIIGATREDESTVLKETVIDEYARIGKEVEIVGGVQVGAYAKIRRAAT